MSLIACTNACVYQEEGVCRLEQAASGGQLSVGIGCIHYVERSSANSELGIPNYSSAAARAPLT